MREKTHRVFFDLVPMVTMIELDIFRCDFGGLLTF